MPLSLSLSCQRNARLCFSFFVFLLRSWNSSATATDIFFGCCFCSASAKGRQKLEACRRSLRRQRWKTLPHAERQQQEQVARVEGESRVGEALAEKEEAGRARRERGRQARAAKVAICITVPHTHRVSVCVYVPCLAFLPSLLERLSPREESLSLSLCLCAQT